MSDSTILIWSHLSGEEVRFRSILNRNVEVVDSGEQLVRHVRRSPSTAIVIIGEDVSLAEASPTAEELRLHDPSLAMILIHARLDMGVVAAAMACGMREAIKSTDVSGLVDAVNRQQGLVDQLRVGNAISNELKGPQGRVAIVYSAKGGVGKTTVAINLAAALSEVQNLRVLVVDLDLQFGDVGVLLGLQNETRNIGNLAGYGESMTVGDILRYVVSYQDKFDVLLAPDTPDKADHITGELVGTLLRQARTEYDVLVVDSPPAFTDEILSAFDVADVQILVTTPDLPSMKNLVVATDTLNRIGLKESPRIGVINRFPSDAVLGRRSVEAGVAKVTESVVVEIIPELTAVAASAVNGGCAYHAAFSNKVKKAFNTLAATVVTTTAATPLTPPAHVSTPSHVSNLNPLSVLSQIRFAS